MLMAMHSETVLSIRCGHMLAKTRWCAASLCRGAYGLDQSLCWRA